MQERAPKLFRELRQTGQMDKHLQDKSLEAHALLDELMAGEPSYPNGGDWKNVSKRQISEELVRAQLIEFQPEGRTGPDPAGKRQPL
jgi:hypothetical protein